SKVRLLVPGFTMTWYWRMESSGGREQPFVGSEYVAVWVLVVPHPGMAVWRQTPCVVSPLPAEAQGSVGPGLWSSRCACVVHDPAVVPPPTPMCTPPP